MEIYRRNEVFQLLNILPIEHPEKISKKNLALNLIKKKVILWEDVKPMIQSLKSQIDEEIVQSVSLAKNSYNEKH